MSILKYLFETELEFPWSWKAETQYGNDAETLLQLDEKTDQCFTGEQKALWNEYCTKSARLHHLECQKEFERGFVLGAKLLMEVVGRAEDAAY